ncbi:MAG: CheY-like superfamily [Benniella sp.]|nr:MAG: CheY-like superfamily [Benniella sp.]
MSHELRTPFSESLGMLSLLRDSSGLSNEQFGFVDMAKASLGDQLKRCHKPSRSKSGIGAVVSLPNFASLDPLVGEDVPRSLGLSGAAIREQESNLPKRARNNDALTLLLTPEERKRCRGKNVLVAEDDFVSQKILKKQLSKLGMNVMITSNGQEAVNQWLSVDPGHYTIAIFDHHMPIMDGLAATMKLRSLEAEQDQNRIDNEKRIRIPIVGLSADIQQSTKESCIKAGMDEYMTKPLLTKGLALLIQRYCCS